jgi:hypothetical protein
MLWLALKNLPNNSPLCKYANVNFLDLKWFPVNDTGEVRPPSAEYSGNSPRLNGDYTGKMFRKIMNENNFKNYF